ncbi:hypothetical protein AB0J86_21895 [Micromonospora sp. NPDC049559]|uniref:hypothetical protein n=1 Tax=Micromonospora sp. NPDC049559 TaxID=3155923 RepID=UPI003449C997
MPATTPPPPPSRPVPGPDWSAGTVTRIGVPWPPPTTPAGPPPNPPAGPPGGGPPDRRRLWWFGAVAAAVLVIGLVAVLGTQWRGSPHPFGRGLEAPADNRPPLARMCPPPTSVPSAQEPPAPADPGPAPAGPRTVDEEAGISYRAYGAPWQPWTTVWSAGTLEVPYKVGQHFVTEPEYDGFSDYHASILSAAVPAANNDALALDIECVGRQVAADVRAEYYPQPNRQEVLRDGRSTLAGRPAWVTVFRLHFDVPQLRAKDELVGLACIDVGRPTAAILYVSIPGTHRQFDHVVDEVLASVRTTG